jgi:hypothetical protein
MPDADECLHRRRGRIRCRDGIGLGIRAETKCPGDQKQAKLKLQEFGFRHAPSLIENIPGANPFGGLGGGTLPIFCPAPAWGEHPISIYFNILLFWVVVGS